MPQGVYKRGRAPAVTRNSALPAYVGASVKFSTPPPENAIRFALHTVDVRCGHPVLIHDPDANDLTEAASLVSAFGGPRHDSIDADPDADRWSTIACDENALVNAQTEVRDAAEAAEDQAKERAKAAKPPLPEYALVTPEPTTVYITGQLPDGRKVGFVVPFQPFCKVELPDTMSEDTFLSCLRSVAWSAKVSVDAISVTFFTANRFKGYVPDPVNPLRRKTFRYAKVRLPNSRALHDAAEALRRGVFMGDRSRKSFAVYEDRIELEQMFVDTFGLVPSGWHDVAVEHLTARHVFSTGRELLVDEEYAVTFGGAFTAVEGESAPPPLCVVSIDGEMTSGTPGAFPKPERPRDAVVTMGLVFSFAGACVKQYAVFERRAFVLVKNADTQSVAPIPGVVVQVFDDEMELIAAVRDELFVRKQVDIVTGHNILKFDMKYLATRVLENRRLYVGAPGRRFLRFGALLSETVKLEEKSLNSAAMGSNNLAMLRGVGFAYLDSLLLLKQNHKLRENSLKYASEYFLKSAAASKFDMPYELIPVAAAGSDVDRHKLTAYCVQDCILVMDLLRTWNTVGDQVAQSRVINILMARNHLVGQQVRVRNSIMRKAHAMNMVMNGVNMPRESAGKAESAQGGFVLDNVPGLHDVVVIVLDFASLYPSVQRRYNLCWSTVLEGYSDAQLDELRAKGVEINTFPTATGTFHFVANVQGVFPMQLTDLLAARRKYKADMAAAPKGSPEWANANCAQLSTKIVMNSGYGTANAQNGIMPCVAVGTATCYAGRQLNITAEAFVRKEFGATTLYGDTDSIMVHFPEPPHIKTACRAVRLWYALKELGEAAEHAVNVMLDSDVVKTECEKAYYPFLSSGKKTYAGYKLTPDDIPKLLKLVAAMARTAAMWLLTPGPAQDVAALVAAQFQHEAAVEEAVTEVNAFLEASTEPGVESVHFDAAAVKAWAAGRQQVPEELRGFNDTLITLLNRVTEAREAYSAAYACTYRDPVTVSVGAYVSRLRALSHESVATPAALRATLESIRAGAVIHGSDETCANLAVAVQRDVAAVEALTKELTALDFPAQAARLQADVAVLQRRQRGDTDATTDGVTDGVTDGAAAGTADEEECATLNPDAMAQVSKFVKEVLDLLDLRKGCKLGGLESKGIRNVRRDVPFFLARMAEEMQEALFYDRDEDKFWDITHKYTEAVSHCELPLSDYVATKELNAGYSSQTTVAPHIAVTYAMEHRVQGSGYSEGDRVPFVKVLEADPGRIVKPAWVGVKASAAAAAAAKKFDDDYYDHDHDVGAAGFGFDADDWGGGGGGGGGTAGAGAGAAAGAAVAAAAKEGASGMYFRHPDEVTADPEHNHIDVVYYVEKGICSLLQQLMPQHIAAQHELIRYARAAADAHKRQRSFAAGVGLNAFMTKTDAAEAEAPSDAAAPTSTSESTPSAAPAGFYKSSRADVERFIPRLSHKKPATAPPSLTFRSLTGEVVQLKPGKKRVSKAPTAGAAAKRAAPSAAGSAASAPLKPSALGGFFTKQ